VLEGSRVVVVVPAFHEELHVGKVVRTMPSFVDDIIVIDDGSRDRTGEVALASGDPRVHVETHPRPRGVGAALTTGYRLGLARTSRPTDALCVMAGDGQMDPDDLARVAGPIVRGEADYVKGERFSYPSVRSSMGLPRWIGGQVFTRLTSLAIGQRIVDSQCGYTALSRGAAEAVDLEGLWPGFGYPNDLLGQLAALHLRVAEVPVRPIYGDETSKLRLRHLPPIFYLIGRAALRRRAGLSSVRATSSRGSLRSRRGVSS
jgi:glycosyltransferase involved in cell wall biosynthesis